MKFVAVQRLMIVILCLFFTVDGFADEKKWHDEAEFSYVKTNGNSDVTTLSFKNLFKYQFNERLESKWKLGALYGESDGIRSAESYMTELRADYKLDKKLYAYGLAGYLTDEFAGFDERFYGGIGAGYKFIDGPKHFFSSELGLNYSLENYTDGTDSDFIDGRAFVLYEYAINEKSQFSQGIEYLYDFDNNDNYRINSDTSLKVQINTALSLKVGYEVRYDNAPTPATLDDTDTRFYTAIVAGF